MPRGGNSFRAVGARWEGPYVAANTAYTAGEYRHGFPCSLSRFRLTTAAAGV
jgi:hypothetical protein